MFTKSNFKKLGHIPLDLVGRAAMELHSSRHWDDITFRQDFPGSPHHDTKAIALRGPREISRSAQESLDAVDYGYAQALPYTSAILAYASGLVPNKGLGRAFCVSLRAGGHIDRHADEGAYAEHYARMHVVLFSWPGNVFECGQERCLMQTGEVWTFNHREAHEVWNDSPQPRIHLIIDYKE